MKFKKENHMQGLPYIVCSAWRNIFVGFLNILTV